MGDFFKRHSYLIIWISALIIIGAIAILILDLNGYVPSITKPNATIQTPATPSPGVTFSVQKSKTGNSFLVQWKNLPNGTTQLDIFRGKTGTPESTWSLWQTVSLNADELANGNELINIGNDTEDGYSFYVQARGDGGGGSNGSSTDGTPITIWTSSSTTPIVATSTPPEEPPGGSPNPPENSSNTPISSTSSAPTPPSSPSSSNPISGGGTPTSTPSTTPTGIPYYNPQVQIDEYGSEPGNFWVQHVNQSIEIGWQNLPGGIDTIIVARAENSSGPWNTILDQQNPSPSGSYSLQIMDDTINSSYYYEMTALNGTTTVANYGPIYLAGQ